MGGGVPSGPGIQGAAAHLQPPRCKSMTSPRMPAGYLPRISLRKLAKRAGACQATPPDGPLMTSAGVALIMPHPSTVTGCACLHRALSGVFVAALPRRLAGRWHRCPCRGARVLPRPAIDNPSTAQLSPPLNGPFFSQISTFPLARAAGRQRLGPCALLMARHGLTTIGRQAATTSALDRRATASNGNRDGPCLP